MIADVLATTGLGSSVMLAVGLGVVVWCLATDRGPRA